MTLVRYEGRFDGRSLCEDLHRRNPRFSWPDDLDDFVPGARRTRVRVSVDERGASIEVPDDLDEADFWRVVREHDPDARRLGARVWRRLRRLARLR